MNAVLPDFVQGARGFDPFAASADREPGHDAIPSASVGHARGAVLWTDAHSRAAFDEALRRLRAAVTGQGGKFTAAELEEADDAVRATCRSLALEIVKTVNDQSLSTASRSAFQASADDVAETLLEYMFGAGPLDRLLHDSSLEDIVVNGAQEVYVHDGRAWRRTDVTFVSDEALMAVVSNLVAHTGRRLTPEHPVLDATLRSGHRINVVGPELTQPGPVVSIRRHRAESFSLLELVRQGGGTPRVKAPPVVPDFLSQDQGRGVFSAPAAELLFVAMQVGFNVVVVGPTGVGKTTILSALGQLIPPDKRVIAIENARELRFRKGLHNAENCAYFTARPASSEGLPEITQRDLVIASLRQRPDALIVGEARSAEVFDLLKACWTGHRWGLTSIHSDNIEDVPTRIMMMLQEADFKTQASEATIAHMIARAFHLGVTVRKTEQGRRYVDEIVEFTGGVEGTVPVRTPLFKWDKERERLLCTGHRLSEAHENELRAIGLSYDAIVASARVARELVERPGAGRGPRLQGVRDV